jgi:RNA polymerase sigma factor (sigma-70 family)
MAVIRSGSVLREIGELFANGAAGTATDGELLARFLDRRGEASESAFASIVERHGPMVLRVCRILTGDTHDAVDALQATFLVLTRRAGSLRNPDRLANWLYGVAHRTARRLRSRSGRRRLRGAREDAMTGLAFESFGGEQPPDLALACQEEAAIVHRELERLSEKHRTAIVLCCLEELTIEEAARRLGCTSGAVRGRLAQARSRLRARLARRGVGVPDGVLAAALSTRTASAALTASFRDATTRAALAYAAGTAAISSASATTLVLADGVSRSMGLARLAVATALVLGVSALGAIATPMVMQRPKPPEGRLTPSSSEEAPLRSPAALSPGPRDHRQLVEGLEWFLQGTDPVRGTISLADLPDQHDADRLALTPAPGGLSPTGLTLVGLAAGPGTCITADGLPADFNALRPGMRVAVRLAPDHFAAVEIRATSPRPPAFLYILEKVDADARTITVLLKQKQLRLETIRVAEGARIQVARMQPVGAGPDSVARIEEISLRGLRPGMPVSLTLAVTEGGGLVASSIVSGTTPENKENSP